MTSIASSSRVTLDRPAKRPAPAFTDGADFLKFDDEPAPEQEPLRKRAKGKLPAAKEKGTARRRAIDVDLEEGEDRQGAQPWAHYVSWHLHNDATSMLNAELAAFADYMSPTVAEHQLRAELIASVARTIRGRWEDAQVLPFGSFATQSYLPFGDIDLVIVSESIGKIHPRKALFQLSALLQSRGLAQDVTVIHRARVPIIKFTSVRANVRIDISLNQVGGLKAVPIVNTLLADNGDRAARAMVAFVKAYLRSRDLNEVYNGGISSFSVICMVVSFLQLHPRVRTGQIDAMDNMGLLLVEFFELYGKHFNYEVVGISVNGGGAYFGKDTRGWNKRTDRQAGLYLCIEDPGEATNDIASGAYNTYAIRQAFAAAYDALITALHDRQYAIYRGQQDRRMPEFLDKPSLLGAIYVMSIDEISKRKLNAQEAFAATRQYAPASRLPPLEMLPKPAAPKSAPPPMPSMPPGALDCPVKKERKKPRDKEKQKAKRHRKKEAKRAAAKAAEADKKAAKVKAVRETRRKSSSTEESVAKAAVAEAQGVDGSTEEGQVSMDDSSDEATRYSLRSHGTPKTSGFNIELMDDDSSSAESSEDESALDDARQKAERTRSFWAAKGQHEVIDLDESD